MRMWNVPTETLCRKHLLGEHVEMHMAAGAIRKGRSIYGHMQKGQLDPINIVRRHTRLAEEMQTRGYKHKSPLGRLKVFQLLNHYPVDVPANLMELARRCKVCKKLQSAFGYR